MKICLIGNCGHTWQAFCEMKAHPQAQFAGIAPGSAEEDAASLKGYGLKIYSTYAQMLDAERPDVAVVSPVFGRTGSVIIDCAARGIDVFAEKPVASSQEELARVERAVRESGIRFSAMHFLRFTPSFYHAQKAVMAGAVGRVQLVTAQKSYQFGNRPAWYADRSLYLGTIPWVGIHAIDWISFFTGKRFLSVSALHRGQPERAALCQFELEDGVIAAANLDYLRPPTAPTHGDDRVRVAGTEGVVEVSEDGYVVINRDGVNAFAPKEAPRLAYDFLEGREELGREEAFMLTRVALCARDAADTGRRVEIGEQTEERV